ncbi:zinc finger domain-containing protein [Microbacterium gorillae]|uniref:zinc finger domain-containing protein n=1 Tax=Microbacterium gorillae TaxID=1231063 RepID=UPI003D993BA7
MSSEGASEVPAPERESLIEEILNGRSPYRVECPSCGAAPGAACYRNGAQRLPHRQRMTAADRELRREVAAVLRSSKPSDAPTNQATGLEARDDAASRVVPVGQAPLIDEEGWPVPAVTDVVMARWSNDNETIRSGGGDWAWRSLAETAISALAQAGLLNRAEPDITGRSYQGAAAPGPEPEQVVRYFVPDGDALHEMLDSLNEAGHMPEIAFRDARQVAGIAYLIDEGDTTRAAFLTDPGEDRTRYDDSADESHSIGMFERPLSELRGPIATLVAAKKPQPAQVSRPDVEVSG